jgi:hypothetical protein
MCSTVVGDALAALEAALDAVAAEDPPIDAAPLDDAARLDRVRRLVTAGNRLDAQLTGAVRQAETHQAAEHDGLKTMGSWLRTHLCLSGGAVTKLKRQGRALEHLPAVAAAYAAGALTADAVDVIAQITRPDNLDRAAAQDIDLTQIEQALVTLATTAPYQDLQAAVATYLARLDPDGAEPDPTEGRSLTLSQHPDGSWTCSGTFDTVGGEKVATALESIAAASRCAGDTRTRPQRLADALVQLADLALASGQLPILRTTKPHVGVLVGIDDLVDPATGPGAATTGLGAAISAARARWIACDSNLSRIIIGPDSAPIDVGRTKRVVPPHIRKAVEVRDRHCVFTGCQAPTWWCEVHHLLEWALHDGETSLDNSALLCERHHTKIHHGFRIERDTSGRWHTYRPDNTEIIIGTPLLV